MSYDDESSMYQSDLFQKDLTHKELDKMLFNKLFCPHTYKKVILWYSLGTNKWSNYTLQMHRTEICERCGKIKTKVTGTHYETFRDMFNYKRMLAESQGYLTEREYLDEIESIKKEYGLTKK